MLILGALSKKLIPTLLIQETSLEDEQIDVEVAEQPEDQLAATKKMKSWMFILPRVT